MDPIEAAKMTFEDRAGLIPKPVAHMPPSLVHFQPDAVHDIMVKMRNGLTVNPDDRQIAEAWADWQLKATWAENENAGNLQCLLATLATAEKQAATLDDPKWVNFRAKIADWVHKRYGTCDLHVDVIKQTRDFKALPKMWRGL